MSLAQVRLNLAQRTFASSPSPPHPFRGGAKGEPRQARQSSPSDGRGLGCVQVKEAGLDVPRGTSEGA